MKKRSIKKILVSVLSIVIMAMIGEYIWSEHQVKTHQGGYVESINPLSYVDQYATIGIKNVHLLAVNSSSFVLKNIVLKDGLIHQISDIQEVQSGIEYIDGTGQFLIPGLVDTHVHLLDSKNDLYLYLTNGVTSICEMFGTQKHLSWKVAAQKGAVSPDMYVATSKLSSQDGLGAKLSKYYGGPINYTSVASAKEGIRTFKEKGYDAIKLGSMMKSKIYTAILEEAAEQQLPVIGHLSESIGLESLYTSGQSQIAHIEEITKNTMYDFGGLGYDNTDAYLQYLKKNADRIAIQLKEHNISVSSTVWLMESLPHQKFDLENFIQTIDFEYANAGIVEGSKISKGWLPGYNDYENIETKQDTERRIKSERYTKTYVEAIKIMTKALATHEVDVLVGTDTNVAGVVPGFSIHDEMQSLSRLGFSNAAVLKAATEKPATFMNSNTGKIKEGYKANLVLLDKNPLENIKNTKAITSVFFGNYRMNKIQIDAILEAIKTVNNKHRSVDIKQYTN